MEDDYSKIYLEKILDNTQNAETAKISIDDVTQGGFFSFDGICTLKNIGFIFLFHFL